MFRPVKTKKVYEEIIEQLKNLIIDGKLQPGDKLMSERELSERLNVSRASVREAFSALEMMGVIDIRPGEGSFVRQVSVENMMEPLHFLVQMDVDFDDIMQVLEARKILEVEVAALAAVRIKPAELAQMREELNRMAPDVHSREMGDEADAAFHLAIVRAAGNSLLVTMMNAIYDVMNKSYRAPRQKLFLVPHMPETLYKMHQSIYDAIAAHNPKRARQLMLEHMELVEQAMLKLKEGGIPSLQEFDGSVARHKINDNFGFPT